MVYKYGVTYLVIKPVWRECGGVCACATWSWDCQVGSGTLSPNTPGPPRYLPALFIRAGGDFEGGECLTEFSPAVLLYLHCSTKNPYWDLSLHCTMFGGLVEFKLTMEDYGGN